MLATGHCGLCSRSRRITRTTFSRPSSAQEFLAAAAFGTSVYLQRPSPITCIGVDLVTTLSAQDPALRESISLRVGTPAFSPVNPLQETDDFFQSLVAEQLVPVEVAVELQQKQVLFRLIAAP